MILTLLERDVFRLDAEGQEIGAGLLSAAALVSRERSETPVSVVIIPDGIESPLFTEHGALRVLHGTYFVHHSIWEAYAAH